MYRRLFNKYKDNPQKLDSIGRLTIKQDSINREFVKFLIKKHTLDKILDDDCDCSKTKYQDQNLFFLRFMLTKI